MEPPPVADKKVNSSVVIRSSVLHITRLGPRLSFLFELCRPGADLWDLFCDHGYLGERALHFDHFPEIHFVDQVPGIIHALKTRLAESTTEVEAARIFFHAQDAMTLDWSKISGNIVMAGIGGELMAKVFARALDTAPGQNSRSYILCPNGDLNLIQKVCLERGFTEDQIQLFPLQEKGRARDVLVVDSALTSK